MSDVDYEQKMKCTTVLLNLWIPQKKAKNVVNQGHFYDKVCLKLNVVLSFIFELGKNRKVHNKFNLTIFVSLPKYNKE